MEHWIVYVSHSFYKVSLNKCNRIVEDGRSKYEVTSVYCVPKLSCLDMSESRSAA
jgi:hypothetical protein